MMKYIAVGLAAGAGAALLEVALAPAVAIGGAAMLAPTLLARLRSQVQPAIDAVIRPFVEPVPAQPDQPATAAPASPLERLGIKRALAKTVTFRVIVTSLDFTTNYLVLGELTTAAGLSTFNLIAGPIFYFAHETAWNHLRPSPDAVDVTTLIVSDAESADGHGGLRISRPLAKTITFRTIATVMDFTTNYVVVGDLVTAVGLSAAGFVLGPFVYWGHERAWDHFSAPKDDARKNPLVEPPAQTNLAP